MPLLGQNKRRESDLRLLRLALLQRESLMSAQSEALITYIETAEAYIDALMEPALRSESIEELAEIGRRQRAFTEATIGMREAFARPKLEVVK